MESRIWKSIVVMLIFVVLAAIVVFAFKLGQKKDRKIMIVEYLILAQTRMSLLELEPEIDKEIDKFVELTHLVYDEGYTFSILKYSSDPGCVVIATSPKYSDGHTNIQYFHFKELMGRWLAGRERLEDIARDISMRKMRTRKR